MIMQKVNLINDDQAHQPGVRAVPTLPRDDVPLFRRGDNHLRRGNLLLAELVVTSQLTHGDSVRLQTFAEIEHHFLDERFHWRDVHDFELIKLHLTALPVHSNSLQHGEHSHVGLASTGGCAHQHILRREQSALVYTRLNTVESLHASERGLRPTRQCLDGNQLLILQERFVLQRWHMHLLVSFLLRTERAWRQLTALIRHQMTA
mmetsp:Transcript_38207/g.95019  ORF Transcript_38207/g.95019 Transcript_38207/m.95019 type:complete len:205 (-) Transcript_38207:1349-1963(-)